MNGNFQPNNDSGFDWGRISDVEPIPDFRPADGVRQLRVSNRSNDLAIVVAAFSLAAFFIVVALFGFAFLSSSAKQNPLTDSTAGQKTEKSLRRVVNTENLNLRTSPGRASGVVDVLPYNTEVELLNKTELYEGKYWVKVRSGNSTGWVNREYLK